MPARDRLGPNGMGPMTGRGAGDCKGHEVGGDATVLLGRRRGIRRARGMRLRWGMQLRKPRREQSGDSGRSLHEW